MSNTKEELNALLKFIDQLCEDPDNKWFKKELQSRFGGKKTAAETSVVYTSSQEERIRNIESYLGLDKEIDNKDSSISYSFVKDTDVRQKLIQDNREMRRYRYGTRGHKVDFYEYCRYALLQMEMLLNYYYTTVDKDVLTDIIKRIKTYNSYYKGGHTSLSSIPVTAKFWAFFNEYKNEINYQDFTEHFTHVCNVRNEVSHRCPEKDKEDISAYKKQLERWGYALTSIGLVNTFILNDEQKKNYEERLKNTPKYKNYKYLIWVNSQPFENIHDTIKEMTRVLKEGLSNIE